MSLPPLGFVGVGNMGRHMAHRLAMAGYTVRVYDISAEAVTKAAAQHDRIIAVQGPREVAAESEIVVTMLPAGPEVEAAVFAAGGLAEGFGSGKLLIDMSSAQPWMTTALGERLAAIGVDMVDAPVSGGGWGAEAGELTIMAGGAAAAVERAMPLFDAMGSHCFHLGPLGSGHVAKTLNNLLSGVTFMASAEVLAIGKRFGVDPKVLADTLNVSTGQNFSLANFEKWIFTREFDSGFALDLKIKDLDIAMRVARETETAVPLSGACHALWVAARSHLGPGRCITEMVRWVEEMTGTELTPNA